jgi:LuxR family transcriptional regulator
MFDLSSAQQSLIEKIECARTIPRATFELGELTKALDFDFWSYGQVSYQNFTKPNSAIMSNLPPEWRQRYQEKKYITIDPVFEHGLQSSKPFVWTDTLYAKAPDLWLDARSFGLHKGWSQSARDANASTVGVLSFVRKKNAISATEVHEKQRRMHWLAHLVHAKISKLQTKKFELSPRELQVMRWTADGKTAAEIASIMLLKERAITFHINNVVMRLGAQNKTAAAVQLAMSGLLY